LPWPRYTTRAAGRFRVAAVHPAYPFWALSLFTLEILALYGLIAYGSRIAES
jgi:hypothetical protein